MGWGLGGGATGTGLMGLSGLMGLGEAVNKFV
jgi:hypothetical protein